MSSRIIPVYFLTSVNLVWLPFKAMFLTSSHPSSHISFHLILPVSAQRSLTFAPGRSWRWWLRRWWTAKWWTNPARWSRSRRPRNEMRKVKAFEPESRAKGRQGFAERGGIKRIEHCSTMKVLCFQREVSTQLTYQLHFDSLRKCCTRVQYCCSYCIAFYQFERGVNVY